MSRGQSRDQVYLAVKAGALPPIKTLFCVDCGKPAKHYDHRDYNKPLDVVPVCVSCNFKRGGAIPSVEEGATCKLHTVEGFTPANLADLKRAADLESRSVASFVRFYLLAAVKQVLNR